MFVGHVSVGVHEQAISYLLNLGIKYRVDSMPKILLESRLAPLGPEHCLEYSVPNIELAAGVFS